MKSFAPETCHFDLMAHAPRRLAFEEARDFVAWRGELDAKLRELVGHLPERVTPNVRVEFETIRRIYAVAGAPEACRLVVGDGGHRFYADDAWPVFQQLTHPRPAPQR